MFVLFKSKCNNSKRLPLIHEKTCSRGKFEIIDIKNSIPKSDKFSSLHYWQSFEFSLQIKVNTPIKIILNKPNEQLILQ